MSANVLIALSGLRSEPIRRLAHWLIWRPARFIALMIVAGLEYHRREIDAAIRGSGPERLPRYDAMI